MAARSTHCGSRAGFVGGTKAVGKWDFGMGVNLIREFRVPRSQLHGKYPVPRYQFPVLSFFRKPVASYGAAWGHAAYMGRFQLPETSPQFYPVWVETRCRVSLRSEVGCG